MHLALPLLLVSLPASPSTLSNLDFSAGRLSSWQGEGFYLTPATGAGPAPSFGVCSSDVGRPGRTALLHRTFVVPEGVGTIHFTAFATAGPDGQPDNHLNVFLEAAGRTVVPKLVRMADGYQRTAHLLPPLKGKPREYRWSVAGRAGETVRIIILDQNKEPGRHVFCSGFRLEQTGQVEAREFTRFMEQLASKNRLTPVGPRYRSKHFLAVGNTDEAFTKAQLERCEVLHDFFLNHFRRKGFRLKAPASRLMVALFNSQEGIEAYLGGRIPWTMTGLYHPASNRLVIYDYGRNRALLRSREHAEKYADSLPPSARHHLLGSVSRQAHDIRKDANLSTIMHEAAHQMSFNTGLFNRDGDHPLWLAEGLATYCEATAQGNWKGIGEINPERLNLLAAAHRGEVALLPVKSLLESDAWLRGPGGGSRALIGYSQCWALFRMLMEEQPRSMRKYMELIYPRRTAEHRLADFVEVFGSDLAKLERRHRDYVKRLVEGVR